MEETRTRTPASDVTPDGTSVSSGATSSAHGTPSTPGAPVDRVSELEAALEAAKAEATGNWDRYLRERAEMENYKKRIERTYTDLAKRGRKELLLKFLSPVDNLQRAIAYDQEGSQEVDARNLVKGLRMTYLQFKELLSSEGLTEIPTVGLQFDPMVHEAIATEAAPDKADGEVTVEVQKGYKLGDELLRPAQVKVVKNT
jgi:molecular chaperone GrpE